MISIGCDRNNQLLPFPFIITKGETIDSWGWFLTCIRNILTQRMGLFVIFDRNLGNMETMTDVHLGWLKHMPIIGFECSILLVIL